MNQVILKNRLFVIFAIPFLLGVVNAFGQQTENTLLRAVPPPGKVVIDGKLDDWDLSGEILSCYDLETLRERHSVRTAMMYDRDHLYVSFRFRDPTPMINHVNPLQQPGGGWKSDCVQMRLLTDRVLHIGCYYFTDGKRPTCHIAYHDMSRREAGFEGDIKEAVGNGVDAAFSLDSDGKGYVQEMRVAWKLLRRDGKAYASGDSFRCGLEFFWGDLTAERWPAHRYADLLNSENPVREFFWMANNSWGEVKLTPNGKLSPAPGIQNESSMEKQNRLRYQTDGVVPVKYELPSDGYATLVIEKSDGTRVRNLISDYPRKAGMNTELWDGTDDNGKLVPSGEYRSRGVFHGEYDLLYQFTYGSPGNPPWETSDGRGDWLADHAAPVSVATDGSWMYMSCFTSEGGSTVIGVDETGQKRWGIGRIPGGILACDGKYLYMIQGGGHPELKYDGEIRIIRIDPRSGKPVPYPDGKIEFLVTKYPSDRPVLKEFEGAVFERKGHNADWLNRESMGLAAAAGKLYLSLLNENKIIVLDAAKGVKLEEIQLDRPVGIVANANGDILAISGVKIVKIKDEKVFPFISEGLEAPMGIATDAAGNSYVSDWGGAMCVKVFSPDGKLLRKIGLDGGRPLTGKYDPKGMIKPLGMAIDSKGSLWVAEHDYNPKRVSVWNAAGTFIKEFCGPTWYGATECNVDTLEPNRAFCMGNIVDLDWEKGLWRIASTMWRPTRANSLFGPFGEGMVLESMELKERKFVVASSTGPYICIAELKDDVARPLVAMGSVWKLCDNGILPEIIVRKLWDNPAHLEWAVKTYPRLFKSAPVSAKTAHLRHIFQEMRGESERLGRPVRTQFIWTDANGDGLVQDAELRVFRPDEAKGVTMGSGWRFAHDSEFTLYPASMVGKNCKAWKMPVKEWNSCCAPVYDIDNSKLIYDETTKYALNSSWADGSGNVLLNQDPLTMVKSDGGTLWTYPNQWPGVHGSHAASMDKRGLLVGPLKVIGSVKAPGDTGEIFCISGNMGKAFLMTADGLYLGSLLRDCRSAPDSLPDSPSRNMSINNTSALGEWFGGEFFKNKTDGKFYLGSAATRGSIISEIIGLESIVRIPAQNIAFTPAQRKEAEKLLAERGNRVQETKQILVSQAVSVKISNPPAVEQFDWTQNRVATWSYDEKRKAEATWTFDDSFLYLAFRNVSDDTPMINNGPIPLQLFKTGDSAVFELRTASGNSKSDVQEGDLRLLFTVFEGKPICLLYRYIVPGTQNPEIFSSPVTSTRIDEARILESVKPDVKRSGNSYSITAAIPLNAIGFKPKTGTVYLGDFGIIHSDKIGKTNELRMFWNNNATGLVSDLAVEAQITPGKWGKFEIK